MRCRNILSSGAFALAGSLVFTPVFAQDTPAAPADQSTTQSPDTSTATPTTHRVRHHLRTATRESRSERKTTEHLNEQQLAQAQSGGSTQTAQAGTMTGMQSTAGGNAQASALSAEATGTAPASADTNSNVGPNQNPSGASEGDANAAPSQMKTAANTNTTMQTSPSTQSGAIPVTQVQNAQQTLAQAKVENTNGKPLGTVQQITRDTNGAPARVQVELDQSLGLGVRSVWIDADQLQYEPRNNAVTTNLTPDQLNSM